MKKKLLIAVAAILLLLVVTNPSPTAFKSYLGYSSYSGLRRTTNFFIFSVYANNAYEVKNKYLGFVGNFWEIPKPKRPYNPSDSDTSKAVDTSMAKMASGSSKDPLGILKKH